MMLCMQVTYLTIADFSMREELVLKIAILAEKFAPSVEVSSTHGVADMPHPHPAASSLTCSACLCCLATPLTKRVRDGNYKLY